MIRLPYITKRNSVGKPRSDGPMDVLAASLGGNLVWGFVSKDPSGRLRTNRFDILEGR